MKQLTSASRQSHHGRVLHHFFTSLRPGDRGAVDPHPAAVPTALRACARLGNASSGRLIHALVLTRFPSLASDAVAATAFLDMYAKCGLVASARWVFEEMPRSDDLVAWNALLAGYASHCSGRACTAPCKKNTASNGGWSTTPPWCISLAEPGSSPRHMISSNSCPRSLIASFLGACRSHGNVELAELAASRLLTVEPANAASCLLLSDALASAGERRQTG
ncbi:hypothetical protein BAE44_0008736 [Dichanthelium oligosanthes]|uniref:Pentatricopeptide repeat-containing protein n=1 Tax=Dichanthelium oligosanthes TaxID=888268 RepID=A0A1E5VYN6_9POAL|nr:hypothetical protein BAE44_0008736 [Dichanthelium oligosanthes]